MRYFWVTIFIVFISGKTLKSQDNKSITKVDESPQVVSIWPAGTEGIDTSKAELEKPRGDRFYNIHNPSVKIFKPESPNGTAIIICAGGGYNYIATGVEGDPSAEILTKFGITIFVLKYRLPTTPGVNFKHPLPLSDALRAIQFVRYNAVRFKVDPNKIGIMGFSAGGHLASMAGTLFNRYSFGSDEISRVSSRPDFMCLAYPVISTKKSIAHGSIFSLIDSTQAEGNILKVLSSELNVTKDTPPAFLFHAKDDKSVSPQNSVLMYEALKKYGIPSELKLYSEGGHGFGIGRMGTDSVNWPKDFIAWLSKMKYIPIQVDIEN